jgi:hypothetical protein
MMDLTIIIFKMVLIPNCLNFGETLKHRIFNSHFTHVNVFMLNLQFRRQKADLIFLLILQPFFQIVSFSFNALLTRMS